MQRIGPPAMAGRVGAESLLARWPSLRGGTRQEALAEVRTFRRVWLDASRTYQAG